MQCLYDSNFTAIPVQYSVWNDLRQSSPSLAVETVQVKKKESTPARISMTNGKLH